MGDFEFNVAKGRTGYYIGLPGSNDGLVAVLLKTTGLDDDPTLKDYPTLGALLAVAGVNDECDFTNYQRQALTNVTWTVDNTNDRGDGDADDFAWPSAGGVSNNDVAKLLICYVPDVGSSADAAIIPLTAHDVVATTDGTTLNISIPTGGFFRAA